MKRTSLALLLAMPLLAQKTAGVLFQGNAELPPSMEVQLQVGLPRGVAYQDFNHHIGYGLALDFPLQIADRHLLRPNLEYSDYRITQPDAPVWAADTERSTNFKAWKLGVDYLLYKEPWVFNGPYALVGIGFQYSGVDYLVQGGNQQSLTTHHSSSTTPWVGVGFGYQVTPDIGLELRYSVASYEAQKGEPLAAYTLTEPIQREGHFIHLILTLRTPY